jgi:hypothetical protein
VKRQNENKAIRKTSVLAQLNQNNHQETQAIKNAEIRYANNLGR